MYNNLYIIGNGFDLHHGIPSSYKDYQNWLIKNDGALFDDILKYYGAYNKEWWSGFETNLGHPDVNDYIDNTAFQNYPNFGSDDFRDRDYYAGEFQAEDEIGKLVSGIKNSFQEWVKQFPKPDCGRKIVLDLKNSFFINFNYTDTLHLLYNVPKNDILSIHGHIDNDEELVLGHNRSYQELYADCSPDFPECPSDIEEIEKWNEEMAERDDFIHQSIRGAVVNQVSGLRKDTAGIIKNNRKIFEELRKVKDVHVYGFSFSDIDLPYLDEILRNLKRCNVKWTVSYYSDSDLTREKEFFSSRNIASVQYIKLEDLVVEKELELDFNYSFYPMKVLFLCMSAMGIYKDLMLKFCEEGHEVYIVSANERRTGKPTELVEGFAGTSTGSATALGTTAAIEGKVHLLGVRTLNVTKTSNFVEKGVGQLLLGRQFNAAIRKYFRGVKFDLILYVTPPITFNDVIRKQKRLNPGAMSYLMLKDIFPQNAVDLGMMSTSGVKGLLYRMFRRKEKELYRLSDYIGCMSPANVKYVLAHNPEVAAAKVEIAPNSCDVPEEVGVLDAAAAEKVREKLGLPVGRPIFIYGGNMGRPQGIPFLVECLRAVAFREDCHFVVVGDGAEYPKLEAFMHEVKPTAVSLFKRLPKEDYDQLAAACDVGLIFLDWRFTIPNYPSRLLSYLPERKPIIAVTDVNCDTGTLAEENGYGFFCPSNSVEAFVGAVDKMLASDRVQMGEKGYRYFLENYTTENTYEAIVRHLR